MYQIRDRVMVLKENEFIGYGTIEDICEDVSELSEYFNAYHPLFKPYDLSIRNGHFVYIVSFDNDMGQGGFTKQELKKMNLKCI